MAQKTVIGIAAAVAMAVGALVSVPSTAQAQEPICYATMKATEWYTEADISIDKPCQLVQAREVVYNNYGLAGTYTGPEASGASRVSVPPSAAPGTYVTHAYRYKPWGHSWSGWLTS